MDAPKRPLLIVEDYPDTHESTRRLLRAVGYEVASAANSEEAFQLLKSSDRPRLILMDVNMPVMHEWWELRKRLLADLSLADIPVVVVSADPKVGNAAASLGVAAYFANPVDVDGLLLSIRGFAGLPPLRQCYEVQRQGRERRACVRRRERDDPDAADRVRVARSLGTHP